MGQLCCCCAFCLLRQGSKCRSSYLQVLWRSLPWSSDRRRRDTSPVRRRRHARRPGSQTARWQRSGTTATLSFDLSRLRSCARVIIWPIYPVKESYIVSPPFHGRIAVPTQSIMYRTLIVSVVLV